MKKLNIAVILLLTLLLASCSAEAPMRDSDTPSKSNADSSSPTADTFEESVAETTVPVSAEPDTVISFLAAGDNIVYLGNVIEAAIYASNGRSYDFKHQYANIKELVSGADIAFVNQETLMCDDLEFSYYPHFNGPRETAYDLLDAGFDIINVANNHMLDWGNAALKDTIGFLRDETDAFTLGDYLSQDEYYSARIYEKEGVKLALLSYIYGTNSGKDDWSDSLVIPILNEDAIKRQVTVARAQSDLVIVSVHWGDENTFEPNEEQLHYAQLMCDLGADVIIGHHPHVIQPVRWLEGEDGHRTLCVYSLGNLCAEMSNGYNMLGGILTFNIVKSSTGTSVTDPKITPTVYYFNRKFRDNQVLYLTDFTEQLAQSHGVLTYGTTLTAEQLRGYVKEVIPAEFLE